MTNKKQKSFLIRTLKRVVGFKEACRIAKDLLSCHSFAGDETLLDIIHLMLDEHYNYRAAYDHPFEEDGEGLWYNPITLKLDNALELHIGKLRLIITLWYYTNELTNEHHTFATIREAAIILKEWEENSSCISECVHHAIRCTWKEPDAGWKKVHTSSYKDVFYPHDFCEDECTVAIGLKNPWQ